MRILCLACEAFARPVYHFAAESPHLVDVKLLRIGLHNTPAVLRTNLQSEIDAADASRYDVIIMSYGCAGGRWMAACQGYPDHRAARP